MTQEARAMQVQVKHQPTTKHQRRALALMSRAVKSKSCYMVQACLHANPIRGMTPTETMGSMALPRGGMLEGTSAADSCSPISIHDSTFCITRLNRSEEARNSILIRGVTPGGINPLALATEILTLSNNSQEGPRLLVNPLAVLTESDRDNTPLHITAMPCMNRMGVIMHCQPMRQHDGTIEVSKELREVMSGCEIASPPVPITTENEIDVIQFIHTRADNYKNNKVLFEQYIPLLKKGTVPALFYLNDMEKLIAQAGCFKKEESGPLGHHPAYTANVQTKQEEAPLKLLPVKLEPISDSDNDSLAELLDGCFDEADTMMGDDDDLQEFLNSLPEDVTGLDDLGDRGSSPTFNGKQKPWQLSCVRCSNNLGFQTPGCEHQVRCDPCRLTFTFSKFGILMDTVGDREQYDREQRPMEKKVTFNTDGMEEGRTVYPPKEFKRRIKKQKKNEAYQQKSGRNPRNHLGNEPGWNKNLIPYDQQMDFRQDNSKNPL